MSELRLGVRQLHDHFALPLLPLVQELGLKGIPFDAKVRDDNVTSIQARLLDIDARLMAAGINNPNSTKKLNEDLVRLGVPLTKKTASGAQFTVDLDVLGRIHHNYNVNLKAPKYPFLPDLITRKRLEKARANLESLRPCKDGKLRTALRSTGTETGRYSSAGLRWCNVCQEPSHGCNTQNFGKNNEALGVNIKDCFVAPAGHVFWEIDHCVAPDTKVLKSDLTWVPAHSLNTGDELIGFDEEYEDSRKGRKFRRSKVIKIKKIIEPSVVVKTSKGDVTCSEKHRWLASYGSKYSWVEAKDIKPGMLIAYFGRTWETRKDYDAGWMAGFLDGEGWISNSACGFGQNFGPIYDKACKYLEEEDLSNQAYKSVRGKLGMVHLARMRDSLRLLGSVRPTRLLSKASKLWEGKKIWGKWTEPALVIDVSSVGKKEVIAIGTETHTFIANGFLSHNSMLELRIMAHVAGVKKLIERLEDPTCNIHKENTLEMFDGRYNDGLRTLSKNLFYAMQYGGSEQAIQMALAKKGEYLDQDFIRSLMLKIFMVYPEIALWQQRVTAECARLTRLGLPRIARNAYGGCRILLGADPTKEWLSTIVQGTAAYTMSFALLRMSESVRRPIIAQIHDAFLGMSPQETWREEMQAVMDEMTRPVWICDKFVKLPADAKVGQTWATMAAVED